MMPMADALRKVIKRRRYPIEMTLVWVRWYAAYPLSLRHDAGYCAAAIGTFLRSLAKELGGDQVSTMGSATLHPNPVNVIAARASLTVDLRNTDEATL